MARPIIATDIRGCREVVKNGKTGLLVPPRNVQELADAIECLYKDRDRARTMGELGRDHVVANFNRDLVHSRLCEFYSSLKHRSAMVQNLEEPAIH